MVIEHGGASCYYDEQFARLTDAFGGHRIRLPVTGAHVVGGSGGFVGAAGDKRGKDMTHLWSMGGAGSIRLDVVVS